jgi:hypothetical protein
MKTIKLFEEFTKENKNLLLEADQLHPNLSKKNLAKLKKLGHTGMKSAILWTDGHSSNPTYIQIPGEDGIPWGSKGPKDRTVFYWDGENAWCTNYPKETLRADYKKSVDTAEEFSDATKSISDSGKWEKVEKMQEQFINERRIKGYHLEELQDDYGYEATMDSGVIYVTGENPWDDDKEYTFSWDGEYAYCETDISDSTYSEEVTSVEEFSDAIDDTDNWE